MSKRKFMITLGSCLLMTPLMLSVGKSYASTVENIEIEETEEEIKARKEESFKQEYEQKFLELLGSKGREIELIDLVVMCNKDTYRTEEEKIIFARRIILKEINKRFGKDVINKVISEYPGIFDENFSEKICSLIEVSLLDLAVLLKDDDLIFKIINSEYIAPTEVTKRLCLYTNQLDLIDSLGFTDFYEKDFSVDVVKVLIEAKKWDILMNYEDLAHPVHVAARSGNLNALKKLLNLGARIELEMGDDNTTPLQTACEFGQFEIVKFLLEEKGANINCIDKKGSSALFYACRSTNLDLIKYLCDKGIPVNSINKDEETLLHIVCNYPADSYRPLRNEIIKWLVDKDLDVNAKDVYNRFPLYVLAQKDNCEMLGFLLEHGADINMAKEFRNKETALVAAVNYQSYKAINFLIESGADLNVSDDAGYSLLSIASMMNDFEMTKLLLTNGVKDLSFPFIDREGTTLLHGGLLYSHNFEFIKFLLKNGVFVDTRDDFGRTPLMFVVEKSCCVSTDIDDIINFFIENQADINAVDNSGKNLLHIACEQVENTPGQLLHLVKFLVDKGVNFNVKDNFGRTPLDIAIKSNANQIVDFLKSL